MLYFLAVILLLFLILPHTACAAIAPLLMASELGNTTLAAEREKQRVPVHDLLPFTLRCKGSVAEF